MAHTINKEGTLYEVSQGQVSVDGTLHPVSVGYANVNGELKEIGFASYDPVFANNTWEQIIEACQTNRVPDTWAVGDSKIVDETATYQHSLVIIGKNHDQYADGSGYAPLTFQFKDAYRSSDSITDDTLDGSETYAYHWVGTDLYTRFNTKANNNYWPMPTLLRDAVKQVLKPCSTVYSGWGTELKPTYLFPLSEAEIVSSGYRSDWTEGTQYEYYSDNLEATRVKYRVGSTTKVEWWTRTSRTNTGPSYITIRTTGRTSSQDPDSKYYLCPGLCF